MGATLLQWFTERAYRRKNLDIMCNPRREPVFIIAAIQCFDDVLYDGAAAPVDSFVVAQPSIRMRYFSEVDSPEGIGTSLVNFGTYKFDATEQGYLRFLADWLSGLAGLGLDLDGFSLVDEIVAFDAGPYYGRYLLVFWRGVELGEGIFIERARTADGRDLTMLDFGFGLERIVWALSGAARYHDCIGPPTLRGNGDPKLADAMRTATLMAMMGVTSSRRGAGYQMRRIASRLVDFPEALGFSAAAAWCHREWSSFITPTNDIAASEASLRRELDRRSRLRLLRAADETAMQPAR